MTKKTKTKIDREIVMTIIFVVAALITTACVLGYRAGRRHAIETARLTGQYGNTYSISFEGEEHYYIGE